jgi:tRNA threonylcarbamoyladenosine biosynthesis protein TsaE
VNVEVTVATAAGMRALGRRLAAVLGAGDLVILSGPLGAGKTTLTQGIGEGLGIRGPVTSPTFVIARVHPPLAGVLRSGAGPGWRSGGRDSGHAGGHAGGQIGPRPALVHADAYRLGSALELDDLDLDADTASSVTVVEWGEGLAEGLADDRLEIRIVPDPGGDADPGEVPADPLAEEPQSTPRTVLIRGVGGRWQDIELPPAELGDRL